MLHLNLSHDTYTLLKYSPVHGCKNCQYSCLKLHVQLNPSKFCILTKHFGFLHEGMKVTMTRPPCHFYTK